MTRGQRNRSNSLLFGSFTGNHFYAMMFQSDGQADSDKLDSETPRSLQSRSSGIHTIQVSEMGHGISVAAGNTSIGEELQHASDMTGEHSISEGSEGSAVRVDMRDVGEESYNFTTSTLRKCKMQVLKPYWGLLIFIGWRMFRHDVITPKSWKLRILNFVYPLLIILLLLYTYMYEMIACEWKLNVVDDTVIATSPKPSTVALNITMTAVNMLTIYPARRLTVSTITPVSSELIPTACDHIITTYLIPNILHFIAYIIGLYYFRIQDNEQMYAMMEKVFLQANPLSGSSSSQRRLITKTRLFLAVGSVWVLLTLVLQGIYVWAFDYPALAIFKTYGLAFHWITFAIELLGRMVFNSVLLAVAINYGTQCEMVMFYVKGLTLRLQEKSVNIKTAFKDTLLLRQNLSLLNGTISKMTTLALVILAELTVIGFSILILNKCNLPKVWIYRSIFPFIWAVMLCFPLFQAARLNSVCLRIKKIALEMRVFGYLSSSQLELDSFLQFVHFNQLRAKLFHIPILPSYIIALFTLVAFVFLILIQTSLLGTHNNFF